MNFVGRILFGVAAFCAALGAFEAIQSLNNNMENGEKFFLPAIVFFLAAIAAELIWGKKAA